jgi:hypothetical protein
MSGYGHHRQITAMVPQPPGFGADRILYIKPKFSSKIISMVGWRINFSKAEKTGRGFKNQAA